MTVLQLGVFALVAVAIGRFKRARPLAMLGAGVFVIYWLQPPQQFVSLQFWLPTATIGLTSLVWLLVTPLEMRGWRLNLGGILTILGVILLVDLNQYFGFEQVYMVTTPRLWVLGIVLVSGILIYGFALFPPIRRYLVPLTSLAIILLLIYLKTPALITKTFDVIYSLRSQSAAEGPYVLSWLGYSYVAFRLLHTIRDHQAGRLPGLTLDEYMNYVIFFPSFAAGPIDRVERFVEDLRDPVDLSDQDWLDAGSRFFTGLFKKFVIADVLLFISISDVLVQQVHSAGWMWFFLYMYSLRIYFDFSGYTDVALGLARVMGVRLPENFAGPYLKPNLTQFWNSWHMTLTQWFRAYFFNPMTRWLRSRNMAGPLVIFLTQISTMILIGLWHGVTLNFFLWGLWHGLGLFIQNRWSEFARTRVPSSLDERQQKMLNALGIFLTFNFVSLGWLFFTLSSPQITMTAFLKLFDLGS